MPRPSRSAGQNPPVTSSHPSNASAAAHSTHTQNVHRNFGIGTLDCKYQYRAPRPFGHALSLMALANVAGCDFVGSFRLSQKVPSSCCWARPVPCHKAPLDPTKCVRPVAVCVEAIVSQGSEPLTDKVRPAGFVAKKCHHACERRHCVANYEKVLASAHERTHNHPGNSARICTPWPFSLDS